MCQKNIIILGFKIVSSPSNSFNKIKQIYSISSLRLKKLMSDIL